MKTDSMDDLPGHYGTEYWAKEIASIRSFKSPEGKRAPYKPLLLLWLIGRVINDKGGVVTFLEAKTKLGKLLSFYRVGTTDPRPEDPFFRLGNTPEIWSVKDKTGEVISKPPSRKAARDESTGMLAPRFIAALKDPRSLNKIVNELLNSEFPELQHKSILDKVGLRGHVQLTPLPRDRNFTKQVRRAYEFRCSFCDFSARLRDELVGLEAAHIQMHAKNGPDTVSNGILLCSQHHELFDAGALGLSVVRGEHRILVSQDLQANMGRRDLVSLSGQKIRLPQGGYEPPGKEHIEWHYNYLFKQPERQLA